MADEIKTIKAIRTNEGDLPVDYEFLANKPSSDTTLTKSGSFADSKAVGDQIKNINNTIREIQGGDALAGITINGKNLSTNPVLTAIDVGAAETAHKHDVADITSGVLPIDKGGIGANNGTDGLKNLLSSGALILTEGQQYGTSTPYIPENEKTKNIGRIFFVKV